MQTYRNYEATYDILKQLNTLAMDDNAFAISEKNRLTSKKIYNEVYETFSELNREQINTELSEILQNTYLAQFFDYRGKRFFLDLPHLRIFAYVYGCLGKFAPNECLADFAVHMARLAQEHINYEDVRVASLINELANQ